MTEVSEFRNTEPVYKSGCTPARNTLLAYLVLKCGDFAYSTLWFREDGSIPSWWILGPAQYGQPHEPIDNAGNVLVRFTALRFPA